MRVLRDKLQTT